MSRTDPQFKLRMPPALRARVEQATKASMRSLSAELVFRVEQSFEGVEVARVLLNNPINALLGFLEGYLLHAAEHPSEPFWACQSVSVCRLLGLYSAELS
ncbi:Arc family DNA-binding protein [Pseudomonas aeruginosa]|uniref:Arc family DNA-binding protein n=1 Tax=Pseudomonas aeruginosa TaxID=287 RepID=UPI00191410D8|nr:Arc family DNA-binding protein [Pseudomonas aeruginosa]MBX5506530.1 Arc family DNA-binding protein [Pseudomonas aeruginosa]MDA3256158.1 Arc family DNA-binding protein [Pseudomonas aeruginosa]HCG0845682.1 Arc family DNA-binding protein [Pseudomonas aeruginosa]